MQTDPLKKRVTKRCAIFYANALTDGRYIHVINIIIQLKNKKKSAIEHCFHLERWMLHCHVRFAAEGALLMTLCLVVSSTSSRF
jgi:hypothetical protein